MARIFRAIEERIAAYLSVEVVADKSYYSGEQIKRCERQGVVTYIPKAHVSPRLKKQLYA